MIIPNKSVIGGMEIVHAGNIDKYINNSLYMPVKKSYISADPQSNYKWAKFMYVFLNYNTANNFLVSFLQGGLSTAKGNSGIFLIRIVVLDDINNPTITMRSLNDDCLPNSTISYKIDSEKSMIIFYFRSLTTDAKTICQLLSYNNESGFNFYTNSSFETINDVVTNDFHRVGGTSDRPNPSMIRNGFMFYDMTIGKPIWWVGNNWRLATGEIV